MDTIAAMIATEVNSVAKTTSRTSGFQIFDRRIRVLSQKFRFHVSTSV
jgi:hypothetical protein